MSVPINKVNFNKELFSWWNKNKRKFYWRNTQNPYQVLVSEVLLHRTNANQVAKVYTKFLQEFPTINELAQAKENEIRKILYPLGLHWRTLFMHGMAKKILTAYQGKVPNEKEELEQLPGVSDYISSAVRCFAFGYPDVLLDTNTVRVVGRVFGLKITDASRRSRRFRVLLESLIDETHPREFNWALIDHAALICVSKNPKCQICPLNNICFYFTKRKHALSNQ